MITKNNINTILKKSEKEKTALLKDILNWAMKAQLVFEKKKSAGKELEGESKTAEENVIKLLNGHIRRLESEKAELDMKLQEAIEESKHANEIKEKIASLLDELEKARAAAEAALHEKADMEEKLLKIQEQWEKLASR